MLNIIGQIFYSSGIIVPLIGTIIGAAFFKRLKPEYRLVSFYLFGSLITQLLYLYFGIIKHSGYNLFLIPIFGFYEFILFSVMYAKFFSQKKLTGFWIIFTIISVLLIAEGIYSYLNQHPASFISYGKILGNISIIAYCGYYLIHSVLDKRKKINPKRINLSFFIFIFYTISLLLYLAINFLVNNSLQIVNYFWFFYAIVTILFYGTLTVLLWKHGINRKPLQ